MTLDLLSLARRMIAIDSRSQRSNLELLEFLIPLCRQAGLQTRLQQEERDGIPQFNLIAGRGPLHRDTLLLATHSDTVPPGDSSLWTVTGGDPFALSEEGGVLYGLGVADVKLDLLCKLLALESLREEPLARNVALAATYGEETGRYGAKLLVKELLEHGPGALPHTVLVGEPTRLRPCTAHKGYLEFRTEAVDPSPRPAPDLPHWRLIFDGVAAHSSQPQHGASANSACLAALALLVDEGAAPDRHPAPERAAREDVAVISVNGGEVVNKVSARCEALVASAGSPDIASLLSLGLSRGVTCRTIPAERKADTLWSPALVERLLMLDALTHELERKLSPYQVPGFEPPYTTLNDGLVRLSDGRLTYAVDVRRVPGEASAQALDEHEAQLRALEGVGAPHAEVIRMRSERVLDSAPFVADDDSPLLAALTAVLEDQKLPTGPEIKSGTTEAAVYRQAGMDAVIFGPGTAGGNIHKPNEHIPVADLLLAVAVYREVILRLCGG